MDRVAFGWALAKLTEAGDVGVLDEDVPGDRIGGEHPRRRVLSSRHGVAKC
jgi:hypothetical protein